MFKTTDQLFLATLLLIGCSANPQPLPDGNAGVTNSPSVDGAAAGGAAVASGGAPAATAGSAQGGALSVAGQGGTSIAGSGGASDGGGGASGPSAGMGGAKGPIAEGLGKACTSKSDCPTGVACLNPSSATLQGDCQPGTLCTSITLTRAGLGWSGGYCATTCTDSNSCGASSTNNGECLFGSSESGLTIIGGQAPSMCVLECGANYECPAGLVCSGGITCGDPSGGAALKFCLPCGASTGAGKAAAAQ